MTLSSHVGVRLPYGKHSCWPVAERCVGCVLAPTIHHMLMVSRFDAPQIGLDELEAIGAVLGRCRCVVNGVPRSTCVVRNPRLR